MAGRDIRGISVSIGGDTTKLQSALQGVNKEIKNTQAQLKDVEKLLKLDPSNTELVRQKQQLLAQAIQETKQKLETLKTASEQANEQLQKGEITQEQYDALQREIEWQKRAKPFGQCAISGEDGRYSAGRLICIKSLSAQTSAIPLKWPPSLLIMRIIFLQIRKTGLKEVPILFVTILMKV